MTGSSAGGHRPPPHQPAQPNPSHDRSRRWRNEWVLLGLVEVLALTLSLNRIIDTDLWLHLAAGRWILDHRAVPREEIFSFTAAGRPWVDLHWGYQVLTILAYRVAGGVGIQILHAVPLLATLAVLLAEVRRRSERQGGTPAAISGAAWLYVAIALLAAQSRILTRPEIFTALFLALTWRASERLNRERTYRCLAWLLPLQIVWANMQGLFVLGPTLMALRGAGFTIDASRGRERRVLAAVAVRHGVATLALLLISIVNPFGINGIALPFRLLSQVAGASVYSPLLAELGSPFEGRVTPPLFATTLVLALGAWVADRKRAASDLLPVLAFGALAVSSRRNLLLFEVVSIVPAGAALTALARRFSRPAERAMAITAAASLVLATLFVAGDRFYYEARSTKETGLGFSRREYPVAATEFLAAAGGGGKILNLLGDGDYLIWHLGPRWRVFFDGRAEVYGEDLGRELFAVYVDEPSYQRMDGRHGFDAIVMDPSNPVGRTFIRDRLQDTRWTLRFIDPRGAVFLPRRSAGEKAALSPGVDEEGETGRPADMPVPRRLGWWRWRVRYPIEHVRMARLHIALERPAAAAGELRAALEIFPHSADLYADYGAALLGAGSGVRAEAAFEAAHRLDADHDAAAAGRARVLEGRGERNAAIAWLAEWVKDRPRAERAWIALSALQARSGDVAAAIRTLEDARRRIPAAAVPLAQLLAGAGQTPRAIEILREHLRGHPEDRTARALLERLRSR